MAEKVTILYEDNHLLVVYKPRGILSQSSGSDQQDMLTILKEYIKEKYQKPGAVYLGLVHRLDINTAGVMVYARTSKAAARLAEQIQNHQFEKKYVAIVEGLLDAKAGMIESKIKKDEIHRVAYIDPTGKDAILSYQVLKEGKIENQKVSLIDVHLKTGRFHQIRVQFSSIGHPLYGDTKYGSKNQVSFDEFPLECYHLAFYHPTTKKWLIFEHQTLDL